MKKLLLLVFLTLSVAQIVNADITQNQIITNLHPEDIGIHLTEAGFQAKPMKVYNDDGVEKKRILLEYERAGSNLEDFSVEVWSFGSPDKVYKVNIFSIDYHSVNKNASGAVYALHSFLATIPFSEEEESKVTEWIFDNLEKDNAEIVINGITLRSTSLAASRSLSIYIDN